MLSAFVYPGLGQLCQRRWVAGLAFILFFTASSIWLIVKFWPMLEFIYYRLPNFDRALPETTPDFTGIAWPLATCVAIILLNVLDVWRAAQRMRRRAPPPIPGR